MSRPDTLCRFTNLTLISFRFRVCDVDQGTLKEVLGSRIQTQSVWTCLYVILFLRTIYLPVLTRGMSHPNSLCRFTNLTLSHIFFRFRVCDVDYGS
jgi:hypothetical protein